MALHHAPTRPAAMLYLLRERERTLMSDIERHAEQAEGSAMRLYAWSVFTLTFPLMISDHASRQVVVAIFPFLKAEWILSDTQLGLLASIIPLIVGLLTIPVSLLVDRWSRVKSITAMACLWSLATLVI